MKIICPQMKKKQEEYQILEETLVLSSQKQKKCQKI